jgi:hypothetical protein
VISSFEGAETRLELRSEGAHPEIETRKSNRPVKTVRYNGRMAESKPFRLTKSVKAAG